jgi:hypothetical protein
MFFAIFTPFYMSALLYQNHTIMRANKNILKRLLEEEKKTTKDSLVVLVSVLLAKFRW